MPLLLKDGTPVDDVWTAVDDTAALPDGPAIISLERWRRERDSLASRNAPLGVHLKSHQTAAELADDLDRLSLVAVELPKFRDGRAFSAARLLRERYGFTGEIRAVGHIIPDQFPLLVRNGVTAVAIPEGANPETWRLALGRITVGYQGALDDQPLSLLRRHLAG